MNAYARYDSCKCDMSYPHRRIVSVLLTVSLAAALAACGASAEIWTRMKSGKSSVAVRKPGKVPNLLEAAVKIYRTTELRMNCVDASKDNLLQYGAVLDGRCYLGATDFLFIKSRSVDFEKKTGISATDCKPTTRCDSASTAFRCREADIVCQGVAPKTGCDPYINDVLMPSCEAVVYDPSGKGAWLCVRGNVFPGVKGAESNCIYLHARRKDIENWVDYFVYATPDKLRAVFAAAYAVETKAMVHIPSQQRCQLL